SAWVVKDLVASGRGIPPRPADRGSQVAGSDPECRIVARPVGGQRGPWPATVAVGPATRRALPPARPRHAPAPATPTAFPRDPPAARHGGWRSPATHKTVPPAEPALGLPHPPPRSRCKAGRDARAPAACESPHPRGRRETPRS